MSNSLHVPFALKTIGVACTAALAIGQASASLIIADGMLDGNPFLNLSTSTYQLGFTVDFNTTSGLVKNGQLWFGQDAGGQFLYFGMPLGFVDNTYGDNAIGWAKGHSFGDLLGSDSLGTGKKVGTGTQFTFTVNGSASPTLVVNDYIAGVVCDTAVYPGCNKGDVVDYRSGGIGTGADANLTKNEGLVVSGTGAGNILEIATSLEWNLNEYPSYIGAADSPVTDSSYNPNLGDAPLWIYNIGYEIQFAPNTFDSTRWLSADPGTGALSLIQLGTSHVSPPKSPLSGTQPPPGCISGCGGEPPPDVCVVNCVPEQNDVPEPPALLLVGGALAALGWSRRRPKRQT